MFQTKSKTIVALILASVLFGTVAAVADQFGADAAVYTGATFAVLSFLGALGAAAWSKITEPGGPAR